MSERILVPINGNDHVEVTTIDNQIVITVVEEVAGEPRTFAIGERIAFDAAAWGLVINAIEKVRQEWA